MDYAAIAKTIQAVIRSVNVPDSVGDLDHRSLRFCASRDPLGQSAVTDFESRLARRVGRKHAIAMSSGTAALHIAMVLAGVGPGTKVWVPAMGFVAGANAVRYCGGDIEFYDCEPVTGIANKPEVGEGDIVLATDLWGNPVDWTINTNTVIEDASQALGSAHKVDGPCGSLGIASVLSFNVNKIVTTGGGGALLTDDDAWADRARHLIGQARDRKTSPAGFLHTELGWNYRMPNVCAALGVEQLGRLDDRIWRRMNLCNALRDALKAHDGVEVVQPPPWSKSNYWIPVLRITGNGTLASAISAERDGLMGALREIGVEAREAFRPLNTLPHLNDASWLPGAVEHWARTVCLPVRC